MKTLLIDPDSQCNSTQFYHDDSEGLVTKEETQL